MNYKKIIFKIFFLIILFFGLFGLAKFSWAATINAVSCSLADVQSAVNSAANGDTVQVPAGICTWNARLQINEKAIKLNGAVRTEDAAGTRINITLGTGYQYYTDAGNDCGINWETSQDGVGVGFGTIVFRITNASSAANTPLEVSNFVFSQDPNNARLGGILIINGDINNPLTKVRVYNNLFRFRTDSGASIWSPVFQAIGYVYGVFHSNTIYTTKPYIYMTINSLDDGIDNGSCAWGLGKHMWYNKTYRPGTANTFIFEDNVWHYYIPTEVHLGGLTHGGSMVLRYNSYYLHAPSATGMGAHDLHGPYKNRTSTQGLESYGNYIYGDSTLTSFSPKLLHLRAGRNLAFFNLMQSAAGDNFRPTISLVRECDECLDEFGTVGPAICTSGLCAGKRKCTQDQQPPFISDSYFFKNFYGTNGTLTMGLSNIGTRAGCTDQLGNCGSTTTVPMPQQNVYWWLDNANCTAASCLVGGIGCGRSAPTGSCQNGSAYWATSQSCFSLTKTQIGAAAPLGDRIAGSNLEGVLYRCESGVWREYFRPYAYPHPLRNVSTTNTAPAAPAGVRVI